MGPTGSSGPQSGWTIISVNGYPQDIGPQFSHQPFANPTPTPAQQPKIEPVPSPTDTLSIGGGVDRLSLTHERSHNARYSPYPSAAEPTNASFRSNLSSPVRPSRGSFSDASGFAASRRVSAQEERIKLPPLQTPTTAHASGQATISLPPISSWESSSQFNDSRAVLDRLRASDATDLSKVPPSPEEHHRRRSSSAPSNSQ
ncbi:hypothetical protein EI94DRAFT_1746173 [Lactarius quietus]|nr:hypothetical protein EI94DRAFT_1746173 [Lactarius quietus]